MCFTYLVIELPQEERRVIHVLEFAITVQVCAVKFDVRMNVFLINMGSYYKLMLPLGELHSQLITDFVRILRTDFARFKRLDTSFQVLNKKSESSLKKQYNESNK